MLYRLPCIYQVTILKKHSSSLITLSYTLGTEQTNWIHGAGGRWQSGQET